MAPTPKEPEDGLMKRFVHACVLALIGVVALWLAIQLLAQFWGWLLLIAGAAGVVYALVWFIRWRRDRRW